MLGCRPHACHGSGLASVVSGSSDLLDDRREPAQILDLPISRFALGLVLVAFFARHVQGTAVFWAGITAQILVFVLFWQLDISYLWYNVIGCAACVVLSLLLQAAMPRAAGARA